MRGISKRIAIFVILCGVVLISSGCSNKMALSPKTKSIDLSKKSIALLTVEVGNSHVPDHQPRIYSVLVGLNANKPKYTFVADDPYIVEKKQFNEHLISIALPPGEYWLNSFFGQRRVPMLLCGSCTLPVEKSFILEPDEIVYIGKVDADIHKKRKGEKSAGGPFPLVDQAICGFHSGAFDVEVFDNYDEDIQLFLDRYPVLQGYQIEKAIME